MKLNCTLWRDLLLQVRLLPLLAFLTGIPLLAQSPNLINYQGRLSDAQGNPVTGNRTMAVKVYDAPIGGNLTYEENIGNVVVTNGTYSFQFGDEGNGIIGVLIGFSDYLALSINGTEETTRTRLLAVPYALKSADAQALAGKLELISGNLTSLQGQSGSLSSNLTSLQSQNAQLSTNFGTLNATVGLLGSNVTALQSQNSGLSSNFGTLNASVSALGSNVTTLQGQSAALSSNVTTLQTQSAGLSTSFGTLNATVGVLGSNVTALEQQNSFLSSNVTVLQNQTSGLSTSVSALNGTVSAVGSNLTALQGQTASLGSSIQVTSADAARAVLYRPYQEGQPTSSSSVGGISFQGAVLEGGQPVNGTRNVSIKIFDSAIGGTELYSENIGNLTVSNGVYAFEYGVSGNSNALTSEVIATTNGTSTSFQKVLNATNVVSGSISVTDGNYTWNQTSGSSNGNDFDVAYNSSLRRITITYYNSAPASGRTITATYRTPTAGISQAINACNQPWLETTIGSTPQLPRQRLLTAPFSFKSFQIEQSAILSQKRTFIFDVKRFILNDITGSSINESEQTFLPIENYINNFSGDVKLTWLVPRNISYLNSIRIKLRTYNADVSGFIYKGSLQLNLRNESGNNLIQKVWSDILTSQSDSIPINLPIPFGQQWSIEIVLLKFQPYGSNQRYGGARLEEMSVNSELSLAGFWEQ